MLTRIIRGECDSSVTNITIDLNTMRHPQKNTRYQGGPRDEWTTKAVQKYWENIGDGRDTRAYATKFNPKNKTHVKIIRDAAEDEFISKEHQDREEKRKAYAARRALDTRNRRQQEELEREWRGRIRVGRNNNNLNENGCSQMYPIL